MDGRASLDDQQNHKNVAQREEVRMAAERAILVGILNIELLCQSHAYILISPQLFPQALSKWNKKKRATTFSSHYQVLART